VLWGDSHAFALAPLLLAAQQLGSPTFEQLTMLSCLPLVHQTSPAWNPLGKCWAFNGLVVREIIRLKREQGLKGVVIAGRWSTLWNHPVPGYLRRPKPPGIRDLWRAWHLRPVESHQQPPAQLLARDLGATLQTLQDAGVKVWIFMDPPELPYFLPSCVYFEFSDLSHCGLDRAVYDAQTAEVDNTLQAVARRFPAVRIFDPTPFLCDSKFCPAFVDNHPVVSDSHHISASSARNFARPASDDISWLQGFDSQRRVAVLGH
jgi:hypothetical protein